MTAGELIAKLQQFQLDSEVSIVIVGETSAEWQAAKPYGVYWDADAKQAMIEGQGV